MEACIRETFSTYPKVEPLTQQNMANRLDVEILNVKNKASPGHPLSIFGTSNEQVIDVLGSHFIKKAALERLQLIIGTPTSEIDAMSPVDLVVGGYCDPVRVFVKNEVHSTKKMKEGRMRIIMSVSLVDQLVSRVVNGRLNNAEVDNFESISSKPGMGLHDEGLAHFTGEIQKMLLAAGTDAERFDTTVEQWALDADARRRHMQTQDPGNFGDSIHLKLARILGKSVVVFSDGEMWSQEVPGIQKSGTYTTSSTNSAIRVLKAALIKGQGPVRVVAMGDDAIEDVQYLLDQETPEHAVADELKRRYKGVGLKIKQVETFVENSKIEFCGYNYYQDGRVEPSHWAKMLAGFLVNWPSNENMRERVFVLDYELRHSPHRLQCLALVEAVNQRAILTKVGTCDMIPGEEDPVFARQQHTISSTITISK